MDIDNEYPSNWLKCADLGGAAHVVTIESVQRETVGEMTKPAVHFASGQGFKPLLLNVTNKEAIKNLYGRETDAWKGKRIELYPDRVLFRSEMVECVRVRVPPRVPQAEAAAPF